MSPLAIFAFCVAAHQQPAGVTAFGVTPSYTDSAITAFNDPHWVYINRNIVIDHKTELPADRHQLLLWLTGTGGKGHDAQRFLTLAANLGYHVLNLVYPDEIAATTCDTDPNPNAFEQFRMAIIRGGQAAIKGEKDMVSVPYADSIENRLVKLLTHLQRIRPREQWSQFLQADGKPAWEKIAVAGQSQGGGHAALIGIKVPVARVICFGAPKDYSKRLHRPAAWYSDNSATPRNRFFAFDHVQDPMGCTPAELWANLQAFEGEAFGQPAQVDSEEYPYRHQHVLYTAYPVVTITSGDSAGARMAHGSAIMDSNAERWQQEWTYLLTVPTEYDAPVSFQRRSEHQAVRASAAAGASDKGASCLGDRRVALAAVLFAFRLPSGDVLAGRGDDGRR